MERLDKLISKNLNITRSDAKTLIKNGSVSVNSAPVSDGAFKCGENDKVEVDGKEINSQNFVYIMQNKPKGVISASEGKGEKTVIDILPSDIKRKGLFPAGRLDKDTEGFVLITDDGAFSHDILSPKKHIDKTYIARLDKPVNKDVISGFKDGIELDGEKLLPAQLNVLSDDKMTVEVIISQGIYHQIKRMFKKYGITVLELFRTKMGELELDKTLKSGEARYITPEEKIKITLKK